MLAPKEFVKYIGFNEDEVYDPYDLLVQVQNKNDIINKIESIPIILDKNFLEMKKYPAIKKNSGIRKENKGNNPIITPSQ